MAAQATEQTHLSAILIRLIELEYDTQAAFEAAVARLKSQAYRQQLRDFLQDQQRHILDLKTLVGPSAQPLPVGPDARQIVVKGLLMLAHLAGDRAILQALAGTMDHLNVAYEQALTDDTLSPEALNVVQRHFVDERRHRTWLLHCIHPEAVGAQGEDVTFNPAFFDLNNRPPVQFETARHQGH